MIVARIPEEIRKYKEKIVFGLTARQLIASIVAVAVCVPLYWYGRKFISEDILSWLIIIIAVPLAAIGFFRFNGMPMEKFIVAFLKYELLFPQKRKFKTENAFREWERLADKENAPKNRKEKARAEKLAREISYERSYLMMKAEESGDTDFDVDKAELLSLSKNTTKARPTKNPEITNKPDAPSKRRS